jgi:hypothetical protein
MGMGGAGQVYPGGLGGSYSTMYGDLTGSPATGPNTGHGGGGSSDAASGAGASGIVIIRYPYP